MAHELAEGVPRFQVVMRSDIDLAARHDDDLPKPTTQPKNAFNGGSHPSDPRVAERGLTYRVHERSLKTWAEKRWPGRVYCKMEPVGGTRGQRADGCVTEARPRPRAGLRRVRHPHRAATSRGDFAVNCPRPSAQIVAKWDDCSQPQSSRIRSAGCLLRNAPRGRRESLAMGHRA